MNPQAPYILRPLRNSDVSEHAVMLHHAFNDWYWKHGWGKDYFSCAPRETAIFFDIYNDLTPGRSIAAFHGETGQILGACFYHPRETHVSLGIMAVHPDYQRQGLGRALVDYILQFTHDQGYRSCRLVGSAINMDSFSLYNRAGFLPRGVYHDMVIVASDPGPGVPLPGEEHVREARVGDVPGMGRLEGEVSGIKREIDYRYAIDNPRQVLHALVYENGRHKIEGFMISVKHPALHMLGTCVARSEEIALALIRRELERFRGTHALLVVPIEKRKIVEQLYAWGARNVETHLLQVWGEFQPFQGVSLPSFLPETG